MSVVGPVKLLGVRHIQVALLFLLLFLANALRVVMSLSIVAMTDPDSQTTPTAEVDQRVVVSFSGDNLLEIFF